VGAPIATGDAYIDDQRVRTPCIGPSVYLNLKPVLKARYQQIKSSKVYNAAQEKYSIGLIDF
jgi:hypothetical protein